jgi:hypothetical protein
MLSFSLPILLQDSDGVSYRRRESTTDTRVGLQITRSIPGTISRTVYSYMSHVKLLGKLALVAVTTVRRAPLEEID